MIKKNFKITLPDEPYKVETNKNIQVDASYEGQRYLVVRAKDGIADCILIGSDEPITDLSNFIEEGHRFFVLDAAENPFAAAYLSHSYKTTEIPNYVEETEAGETYEYVYDDHTGVLEQIYYPNSIPVDENNQFGEPNRRIHNNTRQSTFDGFKVLLEQAKQRREINDYSPEDAAALDDYIEWLETAEVRYANVDHWKIKFPVVNF